MAAAAAQAEVQALLSFLTREAKLPLAACLSKINALRKQDLSTPDAIAKADIETLKSVFLDEKTTKQVYTAAKRVSNPKKRAASSSLSSPSKQIKAEDNPEAHLALPVTDVSIEDLHGKIIETNRAPLFLAFAFCLARYTLPDQPLSSRLSIAQAVTSAGAQSKAKYIGLTDSTAEDEGWAQGQPKVRLMGREVAVMRRHIPVPLIKNKDGIKNEDDAVDENVSSATQEAFWGIDLEALKKSNGPLVAGQGSSGPPIYKPESARAYMLKSIDLVEQDSTSEHKDIVKAEKPSSSLKVKKLTAAERAARRAEAVAMTLKAIDYVLASWKTSLTLDELERRAGSWYATVRPDVEYGQAGWGQRGKVELWNIISLAKKG